MGTPAQRSPVSETPSVTSWWVRSVPGWHLAFGLFVVIAAVVLAIGDDPHRVRAAVALAVVTSTYAALGLRSALHRDRRARIYLGVLVVGLTVVLTGAPTLSFLLFIAFPQTWFFTGSRREGTLWTVGVALAGLVGMSIGYGDSVRTVDIAVSMLVSVGFTCVLGIWIWQLVSQSEERGQLITELESTRVELAAAHHEAGVAAERARLAADIHDTLAQGFTGIVLLAQSAAAGAPEGATRRRLELIEDSARAGLAEARTLVAAMSPVDLVGATLTEALHRLAERVSRESGVQVSVVVEDDPRGLSPARQVVLLRAAQEALGNVRKHAGARSAQVRLAGADGTATLEVRDDGVGITAQDVDGASGFGLAGMRRRVEEAGGVFEVVGEPGGGTRLRVAVPAEVLT